MESDGATFTGCFCENKIEGAGLYIWSDGRKYNGAWKNNMMHGRGRFIWIDGRSYDGEYFEDKKEGYGVYIWENGSKYEGFWKKGLQHGNGILYSKSGNIKSQGKWSEGKFIKYKNLYKKTEELSVASEIRLSPNRRGK